MASNAPTPARVFDAGTLGCGDLLLAVRGAMRGVAPGEVLEVVARDPAAPEDLPSWCRLSGHDLVEASPPVYRIRKGPPPGRG